MYGKILLQSKAVKKLVRNKTFNVKVSATQHCMQQWKNVFKYLKFVGDCCQAAEWCFKHYSLESCDLILKLCIAIHRFLLNIFYSIQVYVRFLTRGVKCNILKTNLSCMELLRMSIINIGFLEFITHTPHCFLLLVV